MVIRWDWSAIGAIVWERTSMACVLGSKDGFFSSSAAHIIVGETEGYICTYDDTG